MATRVLIYVGIIEPPNKPAPPAFDARYVPRLLATIIVGVAAEVAGRRWHWLRGWGTVPHHHHSCVRRQRLLAAVADPTPDLSPKWGAERSVTGAVRP